MFKIIVGIILIVVAIAAAIPLQILIEKYIESKNKKRTVSID